MFLHINRKFTKCIVALQYYNFIQKNNFARIVTIKMMMQKTSLSQREAPLASPLVHQHPLVVIVVDVVALKVHVIPFPMPFHPQSLSKVILLWTKYLQKQVDDDDDDHHHHHDDDDHVMIYACCCYCC
jgi:hypothetical protein